MQERGGASAPLDRNDIEPFDPARLDCDDADDPAGTLGDEHLPPELTPATPDGAVGKGVGDGREHMRERRERRLALKPVVGLRLVRPRRPDAQLLRARTAVP